jgi:hypothetical protein
LSVRNPASRAMAVCSSAARCTAFGVVPASATISRFAGGSSSTVLLQDRRSGLGDQADRRRTGGRRAFASTARPADRQPRPVTGQMGRVLADRQTLGAQQITITSTPYRRRCRLGTVAGAKIACRSRGTAISTGPTSVDTVLDRVADQAHPRSPAPPPPTAGSSGRAVIHRVRRSGYRVGVSDRGPVLALAKEVA